MLKYHPKNERIKKEYYTVLKEIDGKAESTIDGVRKAISRYEYYTKFKDFATIRKEQILGFKDSLYQTKNKATGEVISKSTILSTINILKEFFKWLATQPGYKRKIPMQDIQYLNMGRKDTAIAKTTKFKRVPTLEQIHKAIFAMPISTAVQRRNRAVIAFAILTGMRDSAIASIKLKHVFLEENLVMQEPDEVDTKFSKQIHSWFYPVRDDIKQVVIDWINELKEKQLYGLDDPVFPRAANCHDENHSFHSAGLEPVHWTTATPIRKIFKDAFEAVKLPYYNPHSFRKTLGHMMYTHCKNFEEMKAWSQNLGHENINTTASSYGTLDPHRQGEVIKNIRNSPTDETHDLKRLLQMAAERL